MHDPDSTLTSPLARYAPALSNAFGAIFSTSTSDYALITDVFNSSFVLGGWEDPMVPRAHDASFNPRLARVAQLLIDISGEKTLLVLGAALVASTNQENWHDLPHIEMFQPLAAQTIHLLNETTAATAPDALAIAHALILDTVRHLHISNRSTAERSKILELANKILGLDCVVSRYARFKPILSHAISQQERRCARS